MLEKVLTYIHNWFETDVLVGDWEIDGHTVVLPFLQDGQYYRVVGSVFNDGLHKYPSDDLTDEAFHGAIWPLAVPLEVVRIAEDIADWQEKNGSIADSPFNSESFGGYSYSKGSKSASGDGLDLGSGWESAFNARLIPWRKL